MGKLAIHRLLVVPHIFDVARSNATEGIRDAWAGVPKQSLAAPPHPFPLPTHVENRQTGCFRLGAENNLNRGNNY
jgi:hypothetical protein